jgi:hypothetical protein
MLVLSYSAFAADEPIFISEPISDEVKAIITNKSYKADTPFDYSELAYLTITYIDFEGNSRVGNMIVNAKVGDEVLDIFRELYEAQYPIDKIELIDNYGADDDLSMENNNTSAFNFRYSTNSKVISKHGYGLAIDINPVQNPYVKGKVILPPAGITNRTKAVKGMITKGDACYQAFVKRGWTWGGSWKSLKDYQHFEK